MPESNTCTTRPGHVYGGAKMDDRRFDTLARSIGAIRSRRGVFATLTSAAIAGTLGLDERVEASNHKLADAKCSSDTQCTSGTCLKYGRCKKRNGRLTGKCRCACDTDPACGAGKVCRQRACFNQCSTAGTCVATAFQACGSGTCGCFNTTAPEPLCVFAGSTFCQTNTCTIDTDCPEGYVCSVIQLASTDACCAGKVRTCMAPCQAKSVNVA